MVILGLTLWQMRVVNVWLHLVALGRPLKLITGLHGARVRVVVFQLNCIFNTRAPLYYDSRSIYSQVSLVIN